MAEQPRTLYAQDADYFAPILSNQQEKPWKAGIGSVLVHTGAIALLVAIATHPAVKNVVQKSVNLVYTPSRIVAYEPKNQKDAGGGGGTGELSPATRGKLPRIAPRQFTPPAAVIHNLDPKLPIEPTLVIDSDQSLSKVNMTNYGDPLANLGPPSNGPGSRGGIGGGSRGGIGDSNAPAYGDGPGGPGVFSIGGEVSAPILIYKVEPEYSEDARKAKHQGIVVLNAVIDEKGQPRDLHVIRALSLGLDEKAVEAVRKWRFKPAMKGGWPVPVSARIEVSFRLL